MEGLASYTQHFSARAFPLPPPSPPLPHGVPPPFFCRLFLSITPVLYLPPHIGLFSLEVTSIGLSAQAYWQFVEKTFFFFLRKLFAFSCVETVSKLMDESNSQVVLKGLAVFWKRLRFVNVDTACRDYFFFFFFFCGFVGNDRRFVGNDLCTSRGVMGGF